MKKSKLIAARSGTSSSRRRILASMGGLSTLLIPSIFTRSARAQDQREKAESLRERYSDIESVESVLEEHGSDVLSKLSAMGYLELPDPTYLNIGELTSHKTYSDIRGPSMDSTIANVGVIESDDGALTAHISVARPVKDGVLSIYVNPEEGKSYARVQSVEGKSQFISIGDRSKQGGDASIQALPCETKCDLCRILERCGLALGKAYERSCCQDRDPKCVVLDPCECC